MGDTQRIVIEPTTLRGERGQRYRVHFAGQVLVEDAWNPEFEACRALVAWGVMGRLEVWRAGATCPSTIVPDIAKVATRTVIENDKVGPVFAPWKPRPEDIEVDAVSCDSALLPVAENFSDGLRAP